jgi:hypothetical protein
MNLGLKNEACEVTREPNIGDTIAELKDAKDQEEFFIIAWGQADEEIPRWQGDGGARCACGCGPAERV